MKTATLIPGPLLVVLILGTILLTNFKLDSAPPTLALVIFTLPFIALAAIASFFVDIYTFRSAILSPRHILRAITHFWGLLSASYVLSVTFSLFSHGAD